MKWDIEHMQAHIISLHTSSTPGVGSKVKKNSEITHVAYHINAMEHREPCNHIFCSTPGKRSKGQNIFV